jgi:hypothetical protein
MPISSQKKRITREPDVSTMEPDAIPNFVEYPRDAQRAGTHQELSLKAAFMTLLFS